MARSRGFLSSHKDEEGLHGNRPWVFCMIDAFFLITMFFVMTFHVKNDEKVLQQALSTHRGCGGGHGVDLRTLPVHVMRNGAATVYRMNATEVNLDQMETSLRNSTSGGARCIVRVSYEAGIPFGDVMSVFNACKKAGIDECGMMPLRRSDAL